MDRPLLLLCRALRWRHLRWLGCAAVIPALWACSTHRLAAPDPATGVADIRSFKQDVNQKLDILFMVDNSASMAPLQTKMAAQLPTFMDKLVDDTTKQLPDLHVAVISSSDGGGRWSNVNQCDDRVHPGDDRGKFQQGPGGAGNGTCAGLHAGERYLKSGDGTATNPANYDGDIRSIFQCMALLGESGCGFESQFKSTLMALQKAQKSVADDPDNGGFLRDDAVLAIVMVTNEDDCSVNEDSLLLSPNINSLKDASQAGAFASYRCNEFGHLCDGEPPPHGYDFTTMMDDLATGTYSEPGAPGTGGVVLHNCVSAEDTGPKTDPGITTPDTGEPDPTMGHLWPTVDTFTRFVKSLKTSENQGQILVAAIAGPVEKMGAQYRVFAQASPQAGGEVVPWVDHACTQTAAVGDQPEYGDPAVRISQWIDGFGSNGAFYPICASTFSDAMGAIANKIHQKLGASCISTSIAKRADGTHDCEVDQTITDTNTKQTMQRKLTECHDPIDNAPCFQLSFRDANCTRDPQATTLFKLCNDASCASPNSSSEASDATVSCSVM
ncbi:MAG TPA: hypothetical protein VGP07_13600 [Polyangia bacterium]|jgi:hypothetical protein